MKRLTALNCCFAQIYWLLKLAVGMRQELQVYTVCSALPFVELLHHTSVLCKLLGWQIFLVADCTERIAGKISQFYGTEQWECHHHGEIGKWIARAFHDHHDIDTSQTC